MSSSSQKVQIRCPNCQFDGRVRPDLINRRISCKRCNHIFRATVVEGESATVLHPIVSDSAEFPQANQPLGLAQPLLPKSGSAPAVNFNQELEQIRADLGRSQEQHQDDIRQLRKALDQLIKYQDRVVELEEQLAKTRDNAKAAPADPALADEARSLRGQVAQLNDDLKRLDEAKAGVESELRALRDGESQRTSEANDLRAQLESFRRRAEAAEASLAGNEERDAETETMMGTVNDLQANLAEARSSQAELASLREKLDAALADKAESEKLATLTIQALRDELAAAQAATPGADDAIRQVEDLRAELARDRDASGTQQETIRAELLAARSDLERRTAEADGLREERDALVAQRDDALKADRDGDQSMLDEISELRRRCDDLSAEADRARGAAQEAEQRLRSELASLAEERDTLRAELNLSTSSSQESAQKHQAELSSINDRLQAELANLRQERDGMLAERDQFSASHHEAERRFQTELEELRGSRETLLAEREQLLSNNRDAERRRQAEVAAQKQERDGIAAERDQALATAQEYDRRANELASKLQALEAEVRNIRLERDRATEAEGTRAVELATTRNELTELQKSAGSAQAQAQLTLDQTRIIQKLREELRQKDGELDSLRKERDELKSSQATIGAADDERTIVDRPVLRLGADDEQASVELLRKIQELSEERDRLKVEMSKNQSSKIAWADFENRLSETQEKLKKANDRCKLYEDEARAAREQLIAVQKGVPIKQVDVPSGLPNDTTATSFNIRIVREQRPLSWPEAQARLAIVRQLAAERKDRALLDRINKTAEKVQSDIQNRNATLAETNVRAMEIELGLDPGGWSIGGLKIFRPSQSMLSSLSALTPTLEHEMRQNDLPGILTTLEEMRKVLHEQAGLPEIRRPGRTPVSIRSITDLDAVKLFVSAVEAEQWLMRPINEKRALPDTTLTTYACLIEACSEVRPLVEKFAFDKVVLLDKVVDACSTAISKLQLADGHLPFLDPRGKNTRFAAIVEAMVSARPDAVNNKGWVVAVDPAGIAQFETGFCGIALFRASNLTGRKDWGQSAAKAADWIQGQPSLPNYRANAVAVGLLAHAFRSTKNEKYRAAMVSKLTIGLLPSQVENGRWIDASDAQTTNHLLIIRALQEARAILAEDKQGPIEQVDQALDRAINSLLDEIKVLGVPAQGGALRELIRQRELFPAQADSLRHAIESSATVVQDLCYENGRAKLGVAPDQLAALTNAFRF